jgi:hypothetical protein
MCVTAERVRDNLQRALEDVPRHRLVHGLLLSLLGWAEAHVMTDAFLSLTL